MSGQPNSPKRMGLDTPSGSGSVSSLKHLLSDGSKPLPEQPLGAAGADGLEVRFLDSQPGCPACGSQLIRAPYFLVCESPLCTWQRFSTASTTHLATKPSEVHASTSSPSMLAISHGVTNESVPESGQN
jgi:hypothetical protein